MSSQPLFLCFIDLQYDMLFKILEIRLQSPILVKLLKAFYKGTPAAIKGTNFQYSFRIPGHCSTLENGELKALVARNY